MTIAPLASHGGLQTREPIALVEARARHDRAAAARRLAPATTRRLRVPADRLQVTAVLGEAVARRRAIPTVRPLEVVPRPAPTTARVVTPVVVLRPIPRPRPSSLPAPSASPTFPTPRPALLTQASPHCLRTTPITRGPHAVAAIGAAAEASAVRLSAACLRTPRASGVAATVPVTSGPGVPVTISVPLAA